MDPKRTDGGMFLASGAAGSAASYLFPSGEQRATPAPFPRVDDHLVQPEVSREEIIRGRKIVTMGANPEHAEAHSRADFLILAHVRDAAAVGTDLLTRVNQGSNFATDVSVRKRGIDPQTGARYLEELSFEVVNEQTMRDVTEKAEDLARRGVRRVFAIFVKKGYVGEWSQAQREFVPLAGDGVIEDPMLIRPIAAQALLDIAIAECEVVRALWQKGNPEIKRIHQEGLDEGRQKGLDEGHKKGLDGQRKMFSRLLGIRFGSVSVAYESRIHSATATEIETWMANELTASTIDDVFR